VNPSTTGGACEPVTVVCTAGANVTLAPPYSYVFRVGETGSRFTLYSRRRARYRPGHAYTLTLTTPGHTLVALSPEQLDTLLHCLDIVEDRWREVIEPVTGEVASTPWRSTPAAHVDVTPTPAGLRGITQRLNSQREALAALRRHLTAAAPTEADHGHRCGA